MNRAQLYHNMTTPELKEKFVSLKNELFNLRFQHSTGQLKNPLVLDVVRKDIARVLTVLKEREDQLPRNKGKKGGETKAKPAKEEKKTEAKKPAAKKTEEGGSK